MLRGRQPFFNLMFLLNIGNEIQYTAYDITTRHPIKLMWAFMQNPGSDIVRTAVESSYDIANIKLASSGS